MRLASDWMTSKTMWFALAAILTALGDAAAKGGLTWQHGLVIVIATLGATIRDTIARGQETAGLQAVYVTKSLAAAAGAAQSTRDLAEAMTAVVAAMMPKDAKPCWEQPSATEPDGEADRLEETL